jgi:hypothetical protein
MTEHAGVIRRNAALFWRWFRRWRKRYMWLRLVIIVLIFAEPVYGVFRPLLRDLVVVAIHGIEAAKLGPRLYTRAYEFQEKKRLQQALVAHFDDNGDGRLNQSEGKKLANATALLPEQVAGSALHVELGPLVRASHEAGVLSRSQTATGMRRAHLTVALQEREEEHRALWEEIEPMLIVEYARPADYLRLSTWVRGLGQCFRHVMHTFGPFGGSPLQMGRLLVGASGCPEAQDCLGAWWRIIPAMCLLVFGAVVISVRRFGVGEALERRFREDPEFAAVPCPVCGEATRDYGALRQHRASRAWAAGAVVALVGITLAAVREAGGHAGILVLVIGLAAGFLRWVLWPREVHACHRRPSLRAVGYAVGVALVVALLAQMAAFGMGMREWRPRTRPQRAIRQPPTASARRGSRGGRMGARGEGRRGATSAERRTRRRGRSERRGRAPGRTTQGLGRARETTRAR